MYLLYEFLIEFLINSSWSSLTLQLVTMRQYQCRYIYLQFSSKRFSRRYHWYQRYINLSHTFSHWISGEGYYHLTCVNNEIVIYKYDALFSLHFPIKFKGVFMVYQKIIWFFLKIFIQGFGGVLPIVFYILKNKE